MDWEFGISRCKLLHIEWINQKALLYNLLSHFSRRRQSTRLPRPWDSPGKNTGVGCHFLLQCMKVKSESEVAQYNLGSYTQQPVINHNRKNIQKNVCVCVRVCVKLNHFAVHQKLTHCKSTILQLNKNLIKLLY